jgi:hypothetical protein
MIKTLLLVLAILGFAFLFIKGLIALLYEAKREESKDYQIRRKQKQDLTDAALYLRLENERLTNTKEKL